MIVLITWVFFRSENFDVAWRYLGAMFGAGGDAASSEVLAGYILRPMNWVYFGICGVWTWWLPRTGDFLLRLTVWKVVLGFVLAVLGAMMMFTQEFNPFIYFQF